MADHVRPNPPLNLEIQLLTQLQPAPGGTVLSVGVSAGFSSCESWVSPPRPLGRGQPVSGWLQRGVGRHDLKGPVEVITEILDALIGEVPAEVSPGKLFLHVASQFEETAWLP